MDPISLRHIVREKLQRGLLPSAAPLHETAITEPPRTRPRTCAACEMPLAAGDSVYELETGTTSLGLHAACHGIWRMERIAAITGLDEQTIRHGQGEVASSLVDAPIRRQRQPQGKHQEAHAPEPGPALIGEDLAAFRAADADWRAQHTCGNGGAHPQPPAPQASEETMSTVLDAPRHAATATRLWPTADLRPNPLNPRGEPDPAGLEELAASIVAHAAQGGILQPLLVSPDGTVIAGHRRLAAARRAGLAQVPVLVRDLGPAG